MKKTPFDPNGPAASLIQSSVADLSRRIQAREVSCREIVDGYLERIAAYDAPAGRPIGMQLIGKPWQEATLLGLAQAWSALDQA